MERLKRIFMTLSFVFIVAGFAASVWLYTVLHDSVSFIMMIILLIGAVWYGINVRNIFKST